MAASHGWRAGDRHPHDRNTLQAESTPLAGDVFCRQPRRRCASRPLLPQAPCRSVAPANGRIRTRWTAVRGPKQTVDALESGHSPHPPRTRKSPFNSQRCYPCLTGSSEAGAVTGCRMASVDSRPVPDGEVVQDLIVWATALPPKPGGVVTAAMRRVPTHRSNDSDAGARRNRRPETFKSFWSTKASGWRCRRDPA